MYTEQGQILDCVLERANRYCKPEKTKYDYNEVQLTITNQQLIDV